MAEVILDFIKMTGAGNDFILIDNRTGQFSVDWRALAPVICDRRYGVGADGLLIVENSYRADFKMMYYNSDGSYGGMCGNGGRCIALYIMNDLIIEKIRFEALNYIYSAERLGVNVKLKMMKPKDLQTNLLIDLIEERIPAISIDTGAPHVVVFMEDISDGLRAKIATDGIQNIGSQIRNHNLFKPHGTNVNFVTFDRDNSISMRTYERGIEKETLACGTGSIACAVVSSIRNGLGSPIKVHTRSREILVVDFVRSGNEFEDVVLVGPAKSVFEGRFIYTR